MIECCGMVKIPIILKSIFIPLRTKAIKTLQVKLKSDLNLEEGDILVLYPNREFMEIKKNSDIKMPIMNLVTPYPDN